MEYEYIVIGAAIRAARKARKIRQVDLAEQLGISRAMVVSYEKAHYRIPTHLFLRTCQILELEIGPKGDK